MVDLDIEKNKMFIKSNNRATQISDFFIQKGDNTTQSKIQKLLYYSYVWYLVLHNAYLFDNNIEAWEFGPVIVFKDQSIKGNNLIPKNITRFLNTIWISYGKYSASYLVGMTHKEKPWIDAYQNQKSKIITNDSIIDFYKIEEADMLLPENTVIRKEGCGFELIALNESTVNAINTPTSEYTEYKL